MKKVREFVGTALVYPQLVWGWVSRVPSRVKGTLFPVVHENVPSGDRELIDQLGYVAGGSVMLVLTGVAVLTLAALGVF